MGLPWAELPPSLQVYGIGDIRFGYICYSVLAGIMLRDLFPEPDIVCKTLTTDLKVSEGPGRSGVASWH